MAKQTWMGVGVAALGMTLVLGAKQGVAQEATQGSETAQTTSSAQMSSSSMSEDLVQAQLQVAQLRTQVAQLRQQVVQLRSQLAQASSGSSSSASSGQGVGGSGSAGIGNGSSAIGEGSAIGGSSAIGDSSASSAPSSGDSGFALANVIHTGRVRSVSSKQLVLADDVGGSSTLPLATTVQVTQNGRPVALGSLQEGARVRASANLVTPGNPVLHIEILPAR